jgi:hypothetical protein
MKIKFKRSGGLRGRGKAIDIDTSLLPPDEREDLLTKINKVNFKSITNSKEPTQGADYYIYNITVEDKEKRYDIETNDINIDASLLPLLEVLSRKLDSTPS